MYNIRYAVALSKQKGIKRPAEEEEDDEDEGMSEASVEETDLML